MMLKLARLLTMLVALVTSILPANSDDYITGHMQTRCLKATRDLLCGQKITKDSVEAVTGTLTFKQRKGMDGIPPRDYDETEISSIVGKPVLRDIKKGERIVYPNDFVVQPDENFSISCSICTWEKVGREVINAEYWMETTNLNEQDKKELFGMLQKEHVLESRRLFKNAEFQPMKKFQSIWIYRGKQATPREAFMDDLPMADQKLAKFIEAHAQSVSRNEGRLAAVARQ